mgnify:CR=1 FL=1
MVLLVAFSLFNCNSNNEERPIFVLSKSNLVGIHEIESFILDTKTTTEVSGFPVVINSNSVGNLFQVELIFNADDTYSLKGEYAVTTTITSAGSQPVVNEEILIVNESGTFSVNNTENTISFISPEAAFLTGTLTVSGLSEEKLSLLQTVEETISLRNTLIEADLKISFLRKE